MQGNTPGQPLTNPFGGGVSSGGLQSQQSAGSIYGGPAANNPYGAPPTGPTNSPYGAPPTGPTNNYVAPPAAPTNNYGAPPPAMNNPYGAPPTGPTNTYGAPPAAANNAYGAPNSTYGTANSTYGAASNTYGGHGNMANQNNMQAGYNYRGNVSKSSQELAHETLVQNAAQYNACPPFARASTSRMPNTATMRKKADIPLGMVFQPLAPSAPGQPEIPTVNLGNSVVIRCKRCRTYINPFVKWERGGTFWSCNLCNYVNEAPQFYVYPLDSNGRREDQHERPELSCGSVEYIAPSEYMVRPPQPPSYFFLIDVSQSSVASGLLDVVCETILGLLDDFPGGNRTMFGIITFDSALHFYDLSKSEPCMMVVPDVEGVFVPMAEGAFVNLTDSRPQLIKLIESLPEMWRSNHVNNACYGSALKAAYFCMKHIGGKILSFLSVTPTIGDMALAPGRDSNPLTKTEKTGTVPDREMALLKPGNNSYKDFANVLVQAQISVEIFACSSGPFIDLASIAQVSKHTGGDIHCLPCFNKLQVGYKLSEDIKRVICRETGWEGVMRFRVSSGWKITNWTGHYFFRGNDLLVLPTCHEDQTFSICFEMEQATVTEPQVYVQSALLYSTSKGERRIRVHTYCIPITTVASEVVTNMDTAVVVKLLATQAMEIALQSSVAEAKTFLQNTCSQLMAACGGISKDSIDALPMYILGVLKSPVFRNAREVLADSKVFHILRLESIAVDAAAALFYPRLIAVHSIDPNELAQNSSNCFLPDAINLTCEVLQQNGAYIVDDGETLILWIGNTIAVNWVAAVFGVASVEQIPVENPDLAIGLTQDPVGVKVKNIILEMRRQRRPDFMKLLLVRQGDRLESNFFSALIEDKTPALQISFAEFMAKVAPRKIQQPRTS